MSCPACEGVRYRTRETAYDTFGRRLRAKVCFDCGHHFSTIEVALPPEASMYVLSPMRKWRNKMHARRRRGYHGGIGGAPPKPEPHVEVEIKVKRRQAS